MFKPGRKFVPNPIAQEAITVEKNYLIQKNDYLRLEVYSNKGERLIDPDGELLKQAGNPSQDASKQQLSYLVDTKGVVKFPMIGEMKLDSLTLRQAEEILQKQYNEYYKDCFISLSFGNKRVIILGAVGGAVIPLPNQNINLIEVLATAKGLGNDAKAHNIRVLRGDQVFIIDLSTINGFKAGNLVIEPGDIIYVEPVRRPFVEAFRDYGSIISMLISISTLVVILVNQNQ
jgi:polysaccharide biosynthesis/export protein